MRRRAVRTLGAVLLLGAVAVAVYSVSSGRVAPVLSLPVGGATIKGPRAVGAGCGRLYALDGEGWLHTFDLDGNLIGKLQLVKTVRGFPAGVTVEPDGNLLIADTHEARVRRLSASGQEIASFGNGLGSRPGEFIYPQRIARLGDEIFVTEYGYDMNNRVQVFAAGGEFLRTFGTYGKTGAAFSRPEGIAIGPSGDLFVADAGSHRILRWTPAGEFRGDFGRQGRGPGELMYPYGLAADESFLYVCEDANNRISRFTFDGRFAGCFGDPDEFLHPRGLALTEGYLFVADSGHDRIARLTLSRIRWRDEP